MGATSKDFLDMREHESMINVTFKVKGKHENEIENYIHHYGNVISYKKIRNNDALYKTDTHFQKLVKLEKSARKAKEDYAIKHS